MKTIGFKNTDRRSLFIGGAILILIMFCLIYPAISMNILKHKRQMLGEELGISFENYPPLINFPYAYFEEELVLGMDKAKVHEIVRGYKSKFVCSEGKSELYYFYSAIKDEALQIEVFYDDQNTFSTVKVYDLNSGNPYDDDCLLLKR